jgi:glycine oxidase
MRKFDFIVVGGGIIGMMTARELAQRDASVAIFDRGELGREASWAAGGILSPMRPWAEHPGSTELSEQGKILYPEYIESLKQETGIDSEYIRSGLVIMDEKHADKTRKWAFSNNIELEEDAQNQFSNINIPEHAVLLPEISQLNPSCLLKALRESLKQVSVSIYENTEITGLVTKNNQFEYVEFNDRKIFSDAVIVTAGAWSKFLLGNIGHEINIKPIRGQMVCVKMKESLLDKIVLDGGHYLIPRRDGHVLIGSTMEDVGFINETTDVARQTLLNWAYSLCPALCSAKLVRHWSGLRPFAREGRAIIGQIPGFKNIYLNAGHFRKGILQAPASARLLVDTLSGKNSFMDIENFSVK